MAVFLLTAVPLTFLLTVALMGAQGLPRKTLVTPGIRGGIFALVCYALFYWIEQMLVISYDPAQLFLRAVIIDTAGPSIVMMLGCAILCRWLAIERSTDFFIGWLSFAAGFFTIFGVIEAVYPIGYPSIYQLFLLPALRVSLVLVVASFMTAIRGSRVWMRLAWAAALLGFLGLSAFAPQLYELRYTPYSVLATVAFAGASVGVTYLLQRVYFRSFL